MSSVIKANELSKLMRDGSLPKAYFFYDHLENNVLHPAERIKVRPEILRSADKQTRMLLTQSFRSWACASTRYHRRKRYNQLQGKDRAVAEGDSWFLYPGRKGLGLEDTIDHLLYGFEFPVHSNGCYGDTSAEMLKMADDKNEGYRTPVWHEEPKFFLLSAGGNDILQARDVGGERIGNLYWHLNDHEDGMAAPDYLKPSLFKLIGDVIDTIDIIIRDVSGASSVKRIITHGYGYAVPGRGRGDDLWLADPMDRRDVPNNDRLRRDIVRILIDDFNERIKTLEKRHRKHKHVDLRGLFENRKWWSDPIHVTDAGYEVVAHEFMKAF